MYTIQCTLYSVHCTLYTRQTSLARPNSQIFVFATAEKQSLVAELQKRRVKIGLFTNKYNANF